MNLQKYHNYVTLSAKRGGLGAEDTVLPSIGRVSIELSLCMVKRSKDSYCLPMHKRLSNFIGHTLILISFSLRLPLISYFKNAKFSPYLSHYQWCNFPHE